MSLMFFINGAIWLAHLLFFTCNLKLVMSMPYAKPIPVFKSRLDIQHVLNNTISVVAEVGVQRGIFSQFLLTGVNGISKYYLVDVWKAQKFYDDGANYNNSVQEEIYRETLNRVDPFKSKIEVLRMYSVDAAATLSKTVMDPTTGTIIPILDFLYLDARHDYCGCLEDIVAWWPLLKPGGIMSGHDFMWHHDHEWNLCANGTRIPGGVRVAVTHWAAQQQLQVLVTQRDKYETWSIRKPIERTGYRWFVKPIPQTAKATQFGDWFQNLEPTFQTFVNVNPGSGAIMKEVLWRWRNCKSFFCS